MVTLGADSHKATHTLVAVDETGQKLAQATFAANGDGHLGALRWASQWGKRRWALEDCRNLTRRLERDLLSAGETLVRVPPKLMAGARDSARTRGKSDPIDALAVARAALSEPGLPTATLDGPSRELRLLVAHREDLVAERTRIHNRLRWHLHELAPETAREVRSLSRKKGLSDLEVRLVGRDGLVASLARELVATVRQLNERINQLEREISARTAQLAPSLLTLPGCASLTAAKLVGEVAGASRFRHAQHSRCTTGPLRSRSGPAAPTASGSTAEVTRQLNVALHRIALTQMRLDGAGKDYIAKRVGLGNTKEAIRALRRRISDEVYRRMRSDENLKSAYREEAA